MTKEYCYKPFLKNLVVIFLVTMVAVVSTHIFLPKLLSKHNNFQSYSLPQSQKTLSEQE
jgi:hypothetical protein